MHQQLWCQHALANAEGAKVVVQALKDIPAQHVPLSDLRWAMCVLGPC